MSIRWQRDRSCELATTYSYNPVPARQAALSVSHAWPTLCWYCTCIVIVSKLHCNRMLVKFHVKSSFFGHGAFSHLFLKYSVRVLVIYVGNHGSFDLVWNGYCCSWYFGVKDVLKPKIGRLKSSKYCYRKMAFWDSTYWLFCPLWHIQREENDAT